MNKKNPSAVTTDKRIRDAGNDVRPAVFRFAVEQGLQVLGLQKSERGLEEVFKELTRG